MHIKQDNDRYGNVILKFSPPLNNTRKDDKRALSLLFRNNYEYWSSLRSWIGKRNPETPDLLETLNAIYDTDLNIAA